MPSRWGLSLGKLGGNPMSQLEGTAHSAPNQTVSGVYKAQDSAKSKGEGTISIITTAEVLPGMDYKQSAYTHTWGTVLDVDGFNKPTLITSGKGLVLYDAKHPGTPPGTLSCYMWNAASGRAYTQVTAGRGRHGTHNAAPEGQIIAADNGGNIYRLNHLNSGSAISYCNTLSYFAVATSNIPTVLKGGGDWPPLSNSSSICGIYQWFRKGSTSYGIWTQSDDPNVWNGSTANTSTTNLPAQPFMCMSNALHPDQMGQTTESNHPYYCFIDTSNRMWRTGLWPLIWKQFGTIPVPSGYKLSERKNCYSYFGKTIIVGLTRATANPSNPYILGLVSYDDGANFNPIIAKNQTATGANQDTAFFIGYDAASGCYIVLDGTSKYIYTFNAVFDGIREYKIPNQVTYSHAKFFEGYCRCVVAANNNRIDFFDIVPISQSDYDPSAITHGRILTSESFTIPKTGWWCFDFGMYGYYGNKYKLTGGRWVISSRYSLSAGQKITFTHSGDTYNVYVNGLFLMSDNTSTHSGVTGYNTPTLGIGLQGNDPGSVIVYA